MIKLPSFSIIWHTTRQAIVRFPVQFAIIVFAVVLWFIIINDDDVYQADTLLTILALSNLAFCFTLATDLYSEIESTPISKRWLFRGIGVGFCVLLFFTLSPKWFDKDLYRLGVFILSGHLLLSFLPFIKKENDHTFWQFNKFLLIRFLTAIFYSGVLYLGLAIAVLSVVNLFNLQLDGNIYAHLFGIIGIGFNSLFFLTGIPRNMHSFEEETDYPKGLKLFTQYVLIPLVTIYLVILMSYELKIIIQQSLPKGLVSILILGYAVFGILAFLLVYPIKYRTNHGWVKTFSKLFFYFMIPLLILLFIAIGTRINDYGITIDRYYLVLLALWLSGITTYFLYNKKKNILIIPASLFSLAILSTYGPQSASFVSEKSQLTRIKILRDNNDTENQKASVVRYLTHTHGLPSLQTLTSVDLTALENKIITKNQTYSYQIKTELLDSAYSILGVKPSVPYSGNHIFIERADIPIEISGYEQLIEFDSYSNAGDNLSGKSTYVVRNPDKSVGLKIGKHDSISIDLEPLYKSIRKKMEKNELEYFNPSTNTFRFPDSDLRILTESKHYHVAMVLKNINLSKEFSKESDSFSGIILIKKKKSTPRNLN